MRSERAPSSVGDDRVPSDEAGYVQPVPALLRSGRQPLLAGAPARGPRPPAPLLTPAARKAIRNRMLMLRTAPLDRLREMTGASDADLRRYRRDLTDSELPDLLLARGAGAAFVHEMPQGSLLYVLVRAQRPEHVVETGVRPGYSTAWILAALEANGSGRLTSLGPGTGAGRAPAVHDYTVGQFVAPALRARWTLELGNTEENLERIMSSRSGDPVALFLYDNGPDAARARFELRTAWQHLAQDGILLAHHVDANPIWKEFCRLQGVPPQILDAGPPPMGALGAREREDGLALDQVDARAAQPGERPDLLEAHHPVELPEALERLAAHRLERGDGQIAGADAGPPQRDRSLHGDLPQPGLEPVAHVGDGVRDEPIVEDLVAALGQELLREVARGIVLFAVGIRDRQHGEAEGPAAAEVVPTGRRRSARGRRGMGSAHGASAFSLATTRTGPSRVPG
jgi:hypothetical protein